MNKKLLWFGLLSVVILSISTVAMPQEQENTQQPLPCMKQRSAFTLQSGMDLSLKGTTNVLSHLNDTSQFHYRIKIPVLLGASFEFPIFRHFVMGVQTMGGLSITSWGEDSQSSPLENPEKNPTGLLDVSFLMRVRFPLNRHISWQMPMQFGPKITFEEKTYYGLHGRLALIGLEAFITDSLGVLLDIGGVDIFWGPQRSGISVSGTFGIVSTW